MPEWEYLRVSYGIDGSVYGPDGYAPKSTDPNELGKDGWEMAASNRDPGSLRFEGRLPLTTMWYKREKPAKPSNEPVNELTDFDLGEAARKNDLAQRAMSDPSAFKLYQDRYVTPPRGRTARGRESDTRDGGS